MKIVFALIFSFAPFFLFSQTTLSGIIRNIKNYSIPNATIYLMPSDKKTIVYTSITDSLGQFNIYLSDSIISKQPKFILASYLNYNSQYIPLNLPNSFYEIKIELDEAVLPSVVIESKTPVIQRKSDRFIFTPNKILTEGSTALDVLKLAPSVLFDEKSSIISIINREGTIVYINNRKSTLPKEMIISTLRSTSAVDIKNIEIITSWKKETAAT